MKQTNEGAGQTAGAPEREIPHGNGAGVPVAITPPGQGVRQQRWALDADAIKTLIAMVGDEPDDYPEITLSVGKLQDDDGTVTHGLRVHLTEYPEEGGLMLCECEPAAAEPAARAPLLTEDLEAAARESGDDCAFVAGFLVGARHAEAAHGIAEAA